MASFSKSTVHNAGKRDPKIPRTIFHKGDRRAERWPAGVVERFIDLQGNVTQISMVPPGVPSTPDAVARKRNQMHLKCNHDRSVQGFIEHDKCPLRHGTRHLTETLEAEFSEMPQELQRPCPEDPRVAVRTAKGIEYADGCPHVLWLIQSRIAREADRRESRRARNVNHAEEQLNLAKAQAASTAAVNEKLLTVVESLTAKPARQPKGGE
jgi:hypothetical protein